jgi:cyclophilin family peptidyl-prolyl cis-trans isomerase
MKTKTIISIIIVCLALIALIVGLATQGKRSMSPTHTAVFTTSAGEITLELYGKAVPQTVDNFIKLAQEGFYDGTRFHRVIPNFMIQGGDPLSRDLEARDMWGMGGPGYKFEDEFVPELKNEPGTISMANSGPNTNGSQFFINTVTNEHLDGRHSVFGKVTSGFDIAEAISQVPTDGSSRPLEDIMLESVTISKI